MEMSLDHGQSSWAQNIEQVSENSGFPKFGDLPLEMQDMVWIYAMPSRIVEFIHYSADQTWTSYCTPPAILQVCRRSRIVAMWRGLTPITIAWKPLSFSDYAENSKEKFSHRQTRSLSNARKVFFDFKRDTMFFRPLSSCMHFTMEQSHLDQVENIAIDATVLMDVPLAYPNYFARFPNLKLVTIIAENSYDGSIGCQQPYRHGASILLETNHYPSVREFQQSLKSYYADFKEDLFRDMPKIFIDGQLEDVVLPYSFAIQVWSCRARLEEWKLSERSDSRKKKYLQDRADSIHNKAVQMDCNLWCEDPYSFPSEEQIAAQVVLKFDGWMQPIIAPPTENEVIISNRYLDKIRSIRDTWDSEHTKCTRTSTEPSSLILQYRNTSTRNKPRTQLKAVCRHRRAMYDAFIELIAEYDDQFHEYSEAIGREILTDV